MQASTQWERGKLPGRENTHVSRNGDWGTLRFLGKGDNTSDRRVSFKNSDGLFRWIIHRAEARRGGVKEMGGIRYTGVKKMGEHRGKTVSVRSRGTRVSYMKYIFRDRQTLTILYIFVIKGIKKEE